MVSKVLWGITSVDIVKNGWQDDGYRKSTLLLSRGKLKESKKSMTQDPRKAMGKKIFQIF